MTPNQPAGRDLDVMIAEHVFGAKLGKISPEAIMATYPPTRGMVRVPHYSTDIGDAWTVVEKMGQWNGLQFMIASGVGVGGDLTYGVGWAEFKDGQIVWRIVANSRGNVALAICEAALRAKGVV